MARPLVTVYAEVSADGKTTHGRGVSSKPMMDFEEEPVRRFRHELRAQSDAIMVGSNTVRIDDPSLSVRHVPGRNPLRVIPASHGDLPLDAVVLSDGQPTLVAVSERAPAEKIAALAARGATVISCGSERVDLECLLAMLYKRQIRSLMVEGGATLLAALFRNKLVDRLIVQHLPVIFGGDKVPAMVGGAPVEALRDAIKLRLIETTTIGNHAVIIYHVI